MQSAIRPRHRLRRTVITLAFLLTAAGGAGVAAAPSASALPPACEGIAKQYVASRTEAEAQMFYRAGQLVGCW